MDQNVIKTLSELMQSAAKTHPLFTKIDPATSDDFAKGWAKAAQAMMTPSASAWNWSMLRPKALRSPI